MSASESFSCRLPVGVLQASKSTHVGPKLAKSGHGLLHMGRWRANSVSIDPDAADSGPTLADFSRNWHKYGRHRLALGQNRAKFGRFQPNLSKKTAIPICPNLVEVSIIWPIWVDFGANLADEFGRRVPKFGRGRPNLVEPGQI